jgi:hypothetical protein
MLSESTEAKSSPCDAKTTRKKQRIDEEKDDHDEIRRDLKRALEQRTDKETGTIAVSIDKVGFWQPGVNAKLASFASVYAKFRELCENEWDVLFRYDHAMGRKKVSIPILCAFIYESADYDAKKDYKGNPFLVVNVHTPELWDIVGNKKIGEDIYFGEGGNATRNSTKKNMWSLGSTAQFQVDRVRFFTVLAVDCSPSIRKKDGDDGDNEEERKLIQFKGITKRHFKCYDLFKEALTCGGFRRSKVESVGEVVNAVLAKTNPIMPTFDEETAKKILETLASSEDAEYGSKLKKAYDEMNGEQKEEVKEQQSPKIKMKRRMSVSLIPRNFTFVKSKGDKDKKKLFFSSTKSAQKGL